MLRARAVRGEPEDDPELHVEAGDAAGVEAPVEEQASAPLPDEPSSAGGSA